MNAEEIAAPPPAFEPTMELRWMLSPTPGERPELQQLWRCDAEGLEEWRRVRFVDWNERNVV